MATATTHDQLKLSIVKIVHTMIYVMMASAVLYVFFCGLTGRRDQLLTVAASLVAFEGPHLPWNVRCARWAEGFHGLRRCISMTTPLFGGVATLRRRRHAKGSQSLVGC